MSDRMSDRMSKLTAGFMDRMSEMSDMPENIRQELEGMSDMSETAQNSLIQTKQWRESWTGAGNVPG